MRFPDDRLYSEYHVWVKQIGTEYEIGLSDFAAEELGSINFIELPDIHTKLVEGEPFGFVETSKAAVELIAPISGTVVWRNDEIIDSPEMMFEDLYDKNKLLKLETQGTIEKFHLYQASDYIELVTLQ